MEEINKFLMKYNWVTSLALIGFVVFIIWSMIGESNRNKESNNSSASYQNTNEVFYVLKDGEIEIPRSHIEPFKYILINKTEKGGIITTLSKQVGRTVIDHRKSLVNCKNKTYKILMEGENINDMYKIKNSQWTEIVDGSSMADMVYFVCK